jgi:Uma2 family endonuclease
MAIAVLLEEEGNVEIPLMGSLSEFRAWALSDDFPERGRIDYIDGRIEVDMSPEELYCHGAIKVELIRVLSQRAREIGEGELFSDTTRVSSPEADLSAEPDIVFVSEESFKTGRVREVPKASGEPDRYVELEGGPDLVVEIVSGSSVAKDTKRLPSAYWRASVTEYWLIDARGDDLIFQIHDRGPARFEAVTSDTKGFQPSRVFDCRFALSRRRNRRGRWRFELRQS